MRIVASLLALSAAFISTTALASKPMLQHISGAYGSVEYSANVTCETTGSNTYAFAVRDLQLTLSQTRTSTKLILFETLSCVL
jgi:hypothetical protein